MKPEFFPPPSDWESFGKAHCVPDENTMPVQGDKVNVWFDDDNCSDLTIDAVEKDEIVCNIMLGAVLKIEIAALQICYTRMGTYYWGMMDSRQYVERLIALTGTIPAIKHLAQNVR